MELTRSTSFILQDLSSVERMAFHAFCSLAQMGKQLSKKCLINDHQLACCEICLLHRAFYVLPYLLIHLEAKARRRGYDRARTFLHALMKCSPGWNSDHFWVDGSILNLTGASSIVVFIAETVASSCLMLLKSEKRFWNSILKASQIFCTYYRSNTKNWNRCNCLSF